jgi:hypothetical protein
MNNIFLDDFNKLPQELFSKNNFEEISNKNKIEYKNFINTLWEGIRNLIVYCVN